jgi:hypothetical protein
MQVYGDCADSKREASYRLRDALRSLVATRRRTGADRLRLDRHAKATRTPGAQGFGQQGDGARLEALRADRALPVMAFAAIFGKNGDCLCDPIDTAKSQLPALEKGGG